MINIYKASAGSGKTYTLAREYIKLILGQKCEDGSYKLNSPGYTVGHRSVLAMTFTNKATEEMKSRIIHELAVLAGRERGWTEKSPYEKELCKIFDCDVTDLSRAANDALYGLLNDFSRFSVSTIDSFFQTVLRSFAHEAEVSGNYQLELDDKAVFALSVDELLQNLNYSHGTTESKQLENWITGYMKSLVDEGNQFTLFNRNGSVHDNLIQFIDDIHDDTFREHEKVIMAYFHDTDRFHRFCESIYTLYGETTASIADACRKAVSIIENTPGISSKISKNVVSYLKDRTRISKKMLDITATASKVLNDPTQMWLASVRKADGGDKNVESAVHTAIGITVGKANRLALLSIIRDNLYQLGIMASVMDIVQRFRLENSTLLLSDTNSILSQIIGSDDSPFLYEKLGNRFHNYLVDEFQDTSFSQWNNMRPLMEESLAGDNDNLVIGDEKQCIYRFRNSDPSLLHNLHDEPWIKGRSSIKGDKLADNTNWRSSVEVIKFNNTLFSSMADLYGFNGVYSNVVQQISPKNKNRHGYVSLQGFIGTDSRQEALDYMAQNLRRQLESGYNPGDIAILVRTATEGETIIKYLDSLRESDSSFPHFDIISDKALLIGHSDAVCSILAKLRLMASSDITLDKRTKSHREVARVINDFDNCYSDGMEPADALNTALTAMRQREGSNRDETVEASEQGMVTDLMSLVESLIKGLDEDIKRNDSPYIAAFVDLVLQFVERGQADIKSFLQWWDEQGCRTAVSGGSDSRALNLLTVHKSKGLEFKCVHVPFAQMETRGHGDRAWFELPSLPDIPDEIVPPMMPIEIGKILEMTPFAQQYETIKQEKLMDQTNLLYVAFTRAIDELIIGVKLSKTVLENNGNNGGDVPSVASTIYASISNGLSITGTETDVFTPLMMDSSYRLTVGRPTMKKDDSSKDGEIMLRPSDSVRMPAFDLISSESVWDNTRLDKDHLNHIYIPRERGLILHNIMSYIRTSDDIDRAFTLLKNSPDGHRLSKHDLSELRSIVEARVSDPRAREWFEGFDKVVIERDIYMAEGTEYRIDRVVWLPDGRIIIVDYKSGSQNPKKYRKQMTHYRDFFRQCGYKSVASFLYYLDSGEIVEMV